jgi:hypothetical protein
MESSAPYIPHPLVVRALSTGDLSYLRRHSREISLSLPEQIRVLELAADQEPGALEGDVLCFIKQWTEEVPARRLEDYRTILQAIDVLAFAPERATAQLTSLCSLRGVY